MQIVIMIDGEIGGEVAALAGKRAQSLHDRLSRFLMIKKPFAQSLLIRWRQPFDGRFNFRNRAHITKHSWRWGWQINLALVAFQE